MTEDQVASWYPRLFEVDNVVWQFSTRPMSKKQFEEFNEEIIDGQKVKMPVKSCVFCPGGRGMAASTNDDEPIVQPQTLVGNWESDDNDEWKQKREGWENRMNDLARLANAEDLTGVLNDAIHDPKVIRKFEGRELEKLQEIARKLKTESFPSTDGLSGGSLEALDEIDDIINAELDRRDDERNALESRKDFAEQQQQEFNNQVYLPLPFSYSTLSEIILYSF